ncbi:hypothetical protein EUGRSUZ_L00855 [Eucalyptus grandis]|uniref:Uncharacterized protein n=1 Tax=Eucalyptus grandis TaxID=71139 RepID=A0A058ZVS6_EUCGR|nr:hypothetical protein EUGRSUZ_L00855 [Eucalyptus grandis]
MHHETLNTYMKGVQIRGCIDSKLLSAKRATSWFLMARKTTDLGQLHGQPWKSNKYEQSIKEIHSTKCPVLTSAVILKS